MRERGGRRKKEEPEDRKGIQGGTKKRKRKSRLSFPWFLLKETEGTNGREQETQNEKKKPSEEEKKRGITEREKERAEPRGEGITGGKEPQNREGLKRKKERADFGSPGFF